MDDYAMRRQTIMFDDILKQIVLDSPSEVSPFIVVVVFVVIIG